MSNSQLCWRTAVRQQLSSWRCRAKQSTDQRVYRLELRYVGQAPPRVELTKTWAIGNFTTPGGEGSFCRLPASQKFSAKFAKSSWFSPILWKFKIATSISSKLLNFYETPVKLSSSFLTTNGRARHPTLVASSAWVALQKCPPNSGKIRWNSRREITDFWKFQHKCTKSRK